MSVKDGKITVPISLQDPYTCMGVAKAGGYYDVGYICSNAHGKINKWSKRKPIRKGDMKEIDDSVYKSANYGIGDTPYWIRLASMKTGYLEHEPLPENMPNPVEEYWSYLAPQESNWKRITDFVDYFHAAEPPIMKVIDSDIVYKSDKVATVTFKMGAINDYAIKIADIGIMGSGGDVVRWFSDMFLGICLYNSNKAYYVTQSMKTTNLPELGNTIRISNADKIEGTYDAFAFLSDRAITEIQQADSVVGVYAPIPGTESKIIIKPYSYNFVIIVNYARRKDSRTVEYDYTIINNEDSPYTTDGINIELVDNLNTVLAATSNVYTTIQANSSYTKTATIVTTTSNVVKAALLRVRTKIQNQELSGDVPVTDGPVIQ